MATRIVACTPEYERKEIKEANRVILYLKRVMEPATPLMSVKVGDISLSLHPSFWQHSELLTDNISDFSPPEIEVTISHSLSYLTITPDQVQEFIITVKWAGEREGMGISKDIPPSSAFIINPFCTLFLLDFFVIKKEVRDKIIKHIDTLVTPWILSTRELKENLVWVYLYYRRLGVVVPDLLSEENIDQLLIMGEDLVDILEYTNNKIPLDIHRYPITYKGRKQHQSIVPVAVVPSSTSNGHHDVDCPSRYSLGDIVVNNNVEVAKKNLLSFSRGLLEGLDYDGFVVTGAAVFLSLQEGVNFSDHPEIPIELSFYGGDRVKVIQHFIGKGGRPFIKRSTVSISIFFPNIKRRILLTSSRSKSPFEFISSVNPSTSAVYFDGSKFIGTADFLTILLRQQLHVDHPTGIQQIAWCCLRGISLRIHSDIHGDDVIICGEKSVAANKIQWDTVSKEPNVFRHRNKYLLFSDESSDRLLFLVQTIFSDKCEEYTDQLSRKEGEKGITIEHRKTRNGDSLFIPFQHGEPVTLHLIGVALTRPLFETSPSTVVLGLDGRNATIIAPIRTLLGDYATKFLLKPISVSTLGLLEVGSSCSIYGEGREITLDYLNSRLEGNVVTADVDVTVECLVPCVKEHGPMLKLTPKKITLL